MTAARSVFITSVRSEAGAASARVLIGSLRTFGGSLSGCPFWVFAAEPRQLQDLDFAGSQVEVIPLTVPGAFRDYPFADKVLACAKAEVLSPPEVRSLIWLDPECLVVQPPVLFDLGEGVDAALRPVHLRNVGITPSEPPDPFWAGIYAAAGIQDVRLTVESFVDRQRLRAYFNSHGFSLNPALQLCRTWGELFERLIRDAAFQAACWQGLRRVFLFQAVLSALVASAIDERRLRILPPTYNYPYHLHARLPGDRRAAALNDLVCFAYENFSLRPEEAADIGIREPLRSWLAAYFPASD